MTSRSWRRNGFSNDSLLFQLEVVYVDDFEGLLRQVSRPSSSGFRGKLPDASWDSEFWKIQDTQTMRTFSTTWNVTTVPGVVLERCTHNGLLSYCHFSPNDDNTPRAALLPFFLMIRAHPRVIRDTNDIRRGDT